MIEKYKNYKKHLKEYVQYTLETRKYMDSLKNKPLFPQPCPICKTMWEYTPMFKTHTYQFVKCNECELVYPIEIFKQEVFDEFYKHSDFQLKIWKEEYDVLAEKMITNTLEEPSYVEIIKSIPMFHDKYLDIGCGFGESLHHLKSHFSSVEGVELNEFTSKEGSKLFGVTIHNKSLSEAKLKKESYDCISLLNVIEHLNDLTIFNEIYMLLKPGGVVYIETPFMDSLSMKVFKEKHNAFDNFEHINMFNIEAFNKLAEKYGFTVENIRTDDTLDIQLNDLLKILSKNFMHRVNDIPFINPINVGVLLLTNKFCSVGKDLSKYNLGSYIQVVLRKC